MITMPIRWLIGVMRFLKRKDFPELYPDYDVYHSNVDTGRLNRVSTFIEWIEHNATVLDVGCGDGLVAEYLKRERKVSITGMDVSIVACEKAKKGDRSSYMRLK
jgi:2-polyprenyl-3-methyl-5-hydroxy-6-metoxy-1,4-benzoquinol methylase